MNAEIKAQWISALRSGKYKQGVGKLKQVSEGRIQHCCLGVLCELAKAAGVTSEVSDDLFTYSFGGRVGLLPPEVAEWAGVTGQAEKDLSFMNDQGLTFDQISRAIELKY